MREGEAKKLARDYCYTSTLLSSTLSFTLISIPLSQDAQLRRCLWADSKRKQSNKVNPLIFLIKSHLFMLSNTILSRLNEKQLQCTCWSSSCFQDNWLHYIACISLIISLPRPQFDWPMTKSVLFTPHPSFLQRVVVSLKFQLETKVEELSLQVSGQKFSFILSLFCSAQNSAHSMNNWLGIER